MPQRIFEHALLHCDLRRRLEVLQAATATDAEVGAGRRRARSARREELRHPRELVVGLAAKHFDRDSLADQRALDEHRLAADACDAAAFLVECGDDDGFHGFERPR